MKVYDLEVAVWEAAKARDTEAFLKVVDENAAMVCGGLRCNGAEYADYIKDFDLASYEISYFEVVAESEKHCQVHYVIKTKVTDPKNYDLEGEFHITSTWRKDENQWKLVFNMDSKIVPINLG